VLLIASVIAFAGSVLLSIVKVSSVSTQLADLPHFRPITPQKRPNRKSYVCDILKHLKGDDLQASFRFFM